MEIGQAQRRRGNPMAGTKSPRRRRSQAKSPDFQPRFVWLSPLNTRSL